MSFCPNAEETQKKSTNEPIHIARVALHPNGLQFSRFRFGGYKICTYWLVPVQIQRRINEMKWRWNRQNVYEKKETDPHWSVVHSFSLYHLLNKPYVFRKRINSQQKPQWFSIEFHDSKKVWEIARLELFIIFTSLKCINSTHHF